MKNYYFTLQKKGLRKITILWTILVFFILISSSSISVTLNNTSNYDDFNCGVEETKTNFQTKSSTGVAPNVVVENRSIPKLSSSFGETMLGYIVNSSKFNEGTCYFDVEYPSMISYFQDTESEDFLSGSTGFEGKWIACENSTGALWEINPDNGDMTYIGGGGVSLNGLANDHTSSKIYGVSNNGSDGGSLWLINGWTGEQEYIGDLGSEVEVMIGIAADGDGNLYGWDLGDKLWSIDEATGEATEIGPLGIDLNYAQDGCFDHESCSLYLTAYTIEPYVGSYLYNCDTETGECYLIGQFEGNSQITASTIYLGWDCCNEDVGIKEIISPKDGYANGVMDVVIQVKNYGNNSQEDVPVIVTINKNGEEEYNETVEIDIEWNEIIDVEMPVWTPDDWQSVQNESINYNITAYATVWGDDNTNNDYKEKSFELYYGYFHDVGCSEIIGPDSGPAQTFPVNATIRNFGQYEECCFKTYITISEIDYDTSVQLLYQDFYPKSSFPPDDWTRTSLKWKGHSSNYCGAGDNAEARFYWSPSETGVFRLYSGPMDTSDYGFVKIQWLNYLNHYSGPYTIKVETSLDGLTWTTAWEIVNPGDMPAEMLEFITNKNVGSNTFHISFTFDGYSYNTNWWHIDDVYVFGIPETEPEYADEMCIAEINPGEEVVLEFDEWTPEFLAEETSGQKTYAIKGWTHMQEPEDNNHINDATQIIALLDFVHDVEITEVTSPILKEKKYFGVDGSMQFFWYCLEPPMFQYIGPWPNSNTPAGGTFVGNEWWVCDTTGQIYKKTDPLSADCIFVGSTGTGECVALAYHEKSKVLYGGSAYDLYEIDMDTGSATVIGPFNQLGYYMISLDCDNDGVMYGYDLNYESSRLYTIDLDTGHATPIGLTGVSMMYGQDMAYDNEDEIMYATVYNVPNGGELHRINLETGQFTWICNIFWEINCFAIPHIFPCIDLYINPGIQSIEALIENVGTFPETNMSCYVEIYEYITNCSEGTLVYEDNITGIDLLEPLGGAQLLSFDEYNFVEEGPYAIFFSLLDDNDDNLKNNEFIMGVIVDDTAPVSNHSLNPATPDGLEGYYVSDVEVTLSAYDPATVCEYDGSGVSEIKYSVNGQQGSVSGNSGTFTITTDGNDVEIEYWAIDKVGNSESHNLFTVDMDQTTPEISEVEWEAKNKGGKWYVTLSCCAFDETSDMDRVEMYINDGLVDIIEGPGPEYDFEIQWGSILKNCIFKFVHYDNAGNFISDIIDGSEIESDSFSQKLIYQFIQNCLLFNIFS